MSAGATKGWCGLIMNIAVSGIQWGDEGKGKIVDWLAKKHDVIVRFQGGNNAGHTLVVAGTTFKLSLIPSGILHEGTLNVIGGGTVLDPWAFLDEVRSVARSGVKVTPDRLVIADNTPLLLPIHRELDQLREDAADKGKIGTTLRGIGPAYEDKIGRRAIRLADLVDHDRIGAQLEKLYLHHNALRRGFGVEPADLDSLHRDLLAIAPEITAFGRPVWKLLDDLSAQGSKILFEGAQGALLDIDHGTYPFVTSSSTLPGTAASGAGIAPQRIGHILGICKAYCTRVGAGPFPTELFDSTAQYLADKGHEKGTVTGRNRRCGWFDATLARQVCITAGIDSLAITKIDVLDGLDEIKIGIGYELDGKRIEHFPSSSDQQARVKPIYESIPGWSGKTESARQVRDLPNGARQYLDRIEQLTGKPVRILSTSPRREDTIELSGAG